MNPRLARWIASLFYLGRFPLAAGSLASFVAALFWIYWGGHSGFYLLAILVVSGLGFLTGGATEKIEGKKDPRIVVIDELAGGLIAFSGLPLEPSVLWTTFFLFRAFDMFKIYPANVFEKRPGSFGIMMDDVMAGLYTNLVMQIAVRWAGV